MLEPNSDGDGINPLEQVQLLLDEQFRYNDTLSKLMLDATEERRFEMSILMTLPGFDFNLINFTRSEESMSLFRTLNNKALIEGIITDRNVFFTANNLAERLHEGKQGDIEQLYVYLYWKLFVNLDGVSHNNDIRTISMLTGWGQKEAKAYWAKAKSGATSLTVVDIEPLKQCLELLKPYVSDDLLSSLSQIKDLTKISREVIKLCERIEPKLASLDKYLSDPSITPQQLELEKTNLREIHETLEAYGKLAKILVETMELKDETERLNIESVGLNNTVVQHASNQLDQEVGKFEKDNNHRGKKNKLVKEIKGLHGEYKSLVEDYTSKSESDRSPKQLPAVKEFTHGKYISELFILCYLPLKEMQSDLAEIQTRFEQHYKPRSDSKSSFLPKDLPTRKPQKSKKKMPQPQKSTPAVSATTTATHSEINEDIQVMTQPPLPEDKKSAEPVMTEQKQPSSYAKITQATTVANPEIADDMEEEIRANQKAALIREMSTPSPKKLSIVKSIKRVKSFALQLTIEIREKFRTCGEVFDLMFADKTPHLQITFKQLLQLVANANGEVKPIGGSKFRIKLAGQWNQILAPDSLIECQESTAFVAHQPHGKAHNKGLAQSYVVQQFRDAFVRVGITPENVWREPAETPDQRKPTARKLNFA